MKQCASACQRPKLLNPPWSILNGYLVPEDVAVLGMDDIPEAKYLNPPLSSINSNFAEASDTAAETLINMLMGKPYERSSVIPATLHLRRSSEIDATK